jgi:hypothetical protein
MAKRKNPHAVALGKRGGLVGGKKGGPARMALLTPEERTDLARKAARARWGEKQLSPQPEAALRIETERETDGRWIAEAADRPGMLAYGATEEEAVASVRALLARQRETAVRQQKEST